MHLKYLSGPESYRVLRETGPSHAGKAFVALSAAGQLTSIRDTKRAKENPLILQNCLFTAKLDYSLSPLDLCRWTTAPIKNTITRTPPVTDTTTTRVVEEASFVVKRTNGSDS